MPFQPHAAYVLFGLIGISEGRLPFSGISPLQNFSHSSLVHRSLSACAFDFDKIELAV
jgi:hypothetical protein